MFSGGASTGASFSVDRDSFFSLTFGSDSLFPQFCHFLGTLDERAIMTFWTFFTPFLGGVGGFFFFV